MDAMYEWFIGLFHITFVAPLVRLEVDDPQQVQKDGLFILLT